MGFLKRIFKSVIFFPLTFFAQNITCPSPYIYIDGGRFIRYYDPNPPFSPTHPATPNIPTCGAVLALMPNINGGTLSPTFYPSQGGTYWYWNGSAWINPGH